MPDMIEIMLHDKTGRYRLRRRMLWNRVDDERHLAIDVRRRVVVRLVDQEPEAIPARGCRDFDPEKAP
jgi:hypothetical protein